MTTEVDKITERTWRDLKWRNPRADLVNLAILMGQLQRKGVDALHDDLRSREFKRYLEAKQAALFAHFISSAITKAPIAYAMHEAEDYDCVIKSKVNGKTYCQPVQLKEVVPIELNARATIDGELAKLKKKYVTPSNTIVAMHLNQAGHVVYSEIAKPDVPLAGIWLYASISADQSRWFLYGDLLKSRRGYEIEWPTTAE